jgi:hypothetical protein
VALGKSLSRCSRSGRLSRAMTRSPFSTISASPINTSSWRLSSVWRPSKTKFISTRRRLTQRSLRLSRTNGPIGGFRIAPGGTEILRIRFTEVPANVQVDPEHRYEVAFEEFGSLKTEPVVPSLVHLRDATVKTIKLFGGAF